MTTKHPGARNGRTDFRLASYYYTCGCGQTRGKSSISICDCGRPVPPRNEMKYKPPHLQTPVEKGSV